MKIEAMTATFGKLEGQTLNLRPGLNVIPAPNEWGKSTWCSFLLAMLYGVDTRAKTTKGSLADKEHYAPWSGAPMSGKLMLEWSGRRITIERSTKGRIPLGEFRAYETESGLDFPALTADNCGQMLLGVERNVFRRAGFIRLADLPVTADDDLRRRLNALVTTGDESDDGPLLQKGLKGLQNRICRKPTGQLPQLMQQRSALQEGLTEIHAMQQEHQALESRLQDNEASQRELRNHQAALAYQAAQRDLANLREAEAAMQQAQEQYRLAQEQCREIPSAQEAREKRSAMEQLRKELLEFQQWRQSQPFPPTPPMAEPCFAGLEPEEIRRNVQADAASFQNKKLLAVGLCFAVLSALACGVLLLLGLHTAMTIGVGVLVFSLLSICLFYWLYQKNQFTLTQRYGSESPEGWRRKAEDYIADQADYQRQRERYQQSTQAIQDRQQALRQEISDLCGQQGLDACQQYWEQVEGFWQCLDDAREEANRAARQYETMKAMARPLPPEPAPDSRTETAEETVQLLADLQEQEKKLREADGKLLGSMEALGDAAALEGQLAQLDSRIADLGRYSQAVELAQQTLSQAMGELQRRFAPRISRQGQQFLSRLTLGKYNRLTLDADLNLRSGSSGDTTLREPMWRSEGTADQLYLALRLAVAQELTPDAPLILDDALVRFDQERLEAALELLREIAKDKQVILFTCQEREAAFLRQ